jgi:hypothetical protein
MATTVQAPITARTAKQSVGSEQLSAEAGAAPASAFQSGVPSAGVARRAGDLSPVQVRIELRSGAEQWFEISGDIDRHLDAG